MAEPAPPAHPPPPRPPPSNSHQLPPHPVTAAPKRKLEVEEFKQTSYYKIRAIVRDLRASFLEACRAPDLQNSKAFDEINKKLKVISELYRHVGTERASRSLHTSPASAQDPYKQQHHHQQQQIPAQAKGDYKQKTHLPSDAVQPKLNTNAKSPDVPTSTTTQPRSEPLPPRSAAAAATTTNTALPSVTGIEHLLGGAAATKGTYVVGGSPLGWNFVAYHTSAAPVYGGMSKTEWLAKRAAVAAASASTTTTNAAAASSAVAGAAPTTK